MPSLSPMSSILTYCIILLCLLMLHMCAWVIYNKSWKNLENKVPWNLDNCTKNVYNTAKTFTSTFYLLDKGKQIPAVNFNSSSW